MNLFTQAQPTENRPEPPRAASVAPSRSTDPETSREAGERHERSGKAEQNRQRLLAEACYGPGRTAAELASRLDGIDAWEANRRLPEIRDQGLMDSPRERARECSVKGSKCLTWWPTEAGLKAGPKRG